MAKKTKAEEAAQKAQAATDLFRVAHNNLADAVQLYQQVEDEHRALSESHAAVADAAKADKEYHERVRGRFEGLLS